MTTKNSLVAVLAILAVVTLGVGRASAIPSLQLDIGGGHYVGGTDSTIYSAGDVFTLYALLIPDSSATLARTYYVSTALVPATSTAGSLGSYVFNGNTIGVTTGMVYGNPPIETNLPFDMQDLSPHGMFPTYFTEASFTFLASQRTNAYNSMETPGASFTNNSTGAMYWKAFTVNMTGLAPGSGLHFDLYDEIVRNGGDIDREDFAPFTHDAQGAHSVPEASSLLVLGAGLVGLGVMVRPGRRRTRS